MTLDRETRGEVVLMDRLRAVLARFKPTLSPEAINTAMLVVSNSTDSRVGSLAAQWGRFYEWKCVEREDEPRRVSLEVKLAIEDMLDAGLPRAYAPEVYRQKCSALFAHVYESTQNATRAFTRQWLEQPIL